MNDDSMAHNDEIISYAQNYEDIILWRIFANEGPGFHVDIGACHPVHDSVTQHIYLRGWHGKNIEPQPDLFAEFQRERVRDNNLNICRGSKLGNQTLYVTAGQGTSTLDAALASNYQSTGRITSEIEVDVVPLTDIWKQHVGLGQEAAEAYAELQNQSDEQKVNSALQRAADAYKELRNSSTKKWANLSN